MSLQLCYVNTPQAGEIEALKTPVTKIGRETDNDICPLVVGMSRYHAELEFKPPSWILRDMGSTNGTKVDGVKITKPHTLQEGECLSFGKLQMKVEKAPEPKKKGGPVSLDKGFLKKEDTPQKTRKTLSLPKKDNADEKKEDEPQETRKTLSLPKKDNSDDNKKKFEETNVLIEDEQEKDIESNIKKEVPKKAPVKLTNKSKTMTKTMLKKKTAEKTLNKQVGLGGEKKQVKLNSNAPIIEENIVEEDKTLSEKDSTIEQKLRMKKYRAMKAKAKKDGLDINHENYKEVATNTKNIDRQAFLDTFNKDK